MNNGLESIVPPLDLCKRIPAGRFADSVLVYLGGRNTELVVVPRSSLSVGQFELVKQRSWIMYPAPTLQEILEALDAMFDECDVCVWNTTAPGQWGAQVMDIGRTVNFYEYDSNPAAAALRLWLDVEGVEK